MPEYVDGEPFKHNPHYMVIKTMLLIPVPLANELKETADRFQINPNTLVVQAIKRELERLNE